MSLGAGLGPAGSQLSAGAPAPSPRAEAAPQSLERRFFGLEPTIWLQDVYNSADDYACQAIDVLEKLLIMCYAGVPPPDAAGTSRRAKSKALTAQQQALVAEIKKGADELFEKIITAHESPGDRLEVYSRMQYFSIAGDVAPIAEAALADRAGRAPLDAAAVVSEDEDRELDNKMQALEAELKQELKRGRTLQRIEKALSRRIPEVEDAVARLDEVLAAYREASGGERLEDALPGYLREAPAAGDDGQTDRRRLGAAGQCVWGHGTARRGRRCEFCGSGRWWCCCRRRWQQRIRSCFVLVIVIVIVCVSVCAAAGHVSGTCWGSLWRFRRRRLFRLPSRLRRCSCGCCSGCSDGPPLAGSGSWAAAAGLSWRDRASVR